MLTLRSLWIRIPWSEWLRVLPEELRDPAGLFVLGVGALVVLIVLYRLVRLLGRYLASWYRSGLSGGLRGGLAGGLGGVLGGESRALRRAGDFVSLGQYYEARGNNKAALDAYRQGGCWEEHVGLLVRLGERHRARTAAREAGAWELYGDLCRADGEHLKAAVSFKRAGKLHDAARSFEAGGEPLRAAQCYTAVGLEANAIRLLVKGEGRETAEALDEAIRKSRGDAMSPEMAAATRHAAKLWLSVGQAERAYSLAMANKQWEIAALVARDHLPPTAERAEVCLKAGARLAAADIYGKLGDRQREAMCRAEHYQRRDEPAEAAAWFEKAEAWDLAASEWAACGEYLRAADLFARAEEFAEAAKLYEVAGEPSKVWAMEAALQARSPQAFAQDDVTRRAAQTTAPPGETTAVALPAGPTIPLPTTDERYVLQEEIGRGGMGVVYRAQDAMLKRLVAYKVVSTNVPGVDPTELLEEARAAARLSHPNIVQVYDAGQTRSGFFVVMELVEGETIADLLKKHRFSVPGSIAVGQQICAALNHAHKRRIVHRDLKPSNLMWTSENQVKLTDFGLARAFEGAVGKVMTRAAGTPYYMSPEQIRGVAVDPRSDIYSFGCVLYELLCQRAPFVGGDSIQHHLTSQPEDPRHSRSEIPPVLAGIILNCLEKDPDRRPASAEQVHRMLAAVGS